MSGLGRRTPLRRQQILAQRDGQEPTPRIPRQRAALTCSEEDCDGPRYCKGLCVKHYERLRKWGNTLGRTAEVRFWEKVTKGPGAEDCWEWRGAKTPEGYGNFNLGGNKYDKAHRVSYRWLAGSIPAGLHLDHLCRNRACVNPEHLEPVTPKENARRGHSPSMIANRTGLCHRGHSMEDAYEAHRADGTVTRRCRTCQTTRNRQRAARRPGRKRLAGHVRQALYERTKGQCEKCGGRMALGSMHAHHRKLRSQGGKDELPNLLGVHDLCHNGHTRSIHLNVGEAYVNGWLVRSHDDPATTCVLRAGHYVYLGHDGTVTTRQEDSA